MQSLLALVGFFVFAPTLGHDLVWDDPFLIEYVRGLVSDGGPSALLTAEFRIQSDLGYYRPVVLLSLWTDSLLTQSSNVAFHLTNTLLHVASTLLVWRVARYLVQPLAAVLAALFFAVHPAHTESVAFVSGRTDLWATAFVLVSSLFWVRARFGNASSTRIQVSTSAVAMLLATLSKEVAYLLPAVLVAWDGIAFGIADGKAWWSRNRPWLAAWTASLAISLALRLGVAGIGFGVRDEAEPVLRHSASLLAGIWATYLRLLAMPWPLTAHYTEAQVALDPWSAVVALAWLGLSLLLWKRWQLKIGLLALIWVVGFLLPVSGLMPLGGNLLAERFLYLPSVSACMLLGVLFAGLPGRPSMRSVLAVAGFVLVAVFFARTFSHSKVWRSEYSLFAETVRSSPESLIAHYNLANTLAQGSQLDQALAEYSTALRLDPEHVRARNNRGLVLARLGRTEEAIHDFRRVLEIDPDHANAQLNLGRTFAQLGQWPEAVSAFRRLSELRPGDATAHYNLGSALANVAAYEAAAQAFETSLDLDAGRASTYDALARVYRRLGRHADATAVLRRAPAKSPSN